MTSLAGDPRWAVFGGKDGGYRLAFILNPADDGLRACAPVSDQTFEVSDDNRKITVAVDGRPVSCSFGLRRNLSALKFEGGHGLARENLAK